MKKINLYREKIYIKTADILQALNSKKEFVITIDGDVKFEFDNNEIIIFKGEFPKTNLLLQPPTLKSVLGDGYIVKLKDNMFEINCMGAWQRIYKFNINNATYDDGGEGINEFDDEELEDIGWYATDFDINYRTLVDIIEKNCNMVLLCNEIDDGDNYIFNGLGFVKDMECARTTIKEFVIKEIKDKLSNDSEYKRETLDKSQLKALKYFNI